MTMIEIVENPKKKKRRSVKRRRKTTKRAKRRNPVVATLSNPRRRKRRVVQKRRRYSRRRNPIGALGGLINLPMAGSIAAGFMVARIAPNMVQKVWAGAPTTGPISYVVRAGATIGVAYVVKTYLKQRELALGIATGGLAYVLYDLANEYLLPKIGLAGIGYNDAYMTMSELDDIEARGADPGVSGYIDTGVAGYESSHVGLLDEALAA